MNANTSHGSTRRSGARRATGRASTYRKTSSTKAGGSKRGVATASVGKIGDYQLGYDRVQIWWRDGTGAEFDIMPDAGGPIRIDIGLDDDQWWRVISWTMHELAEVAMTKLSCRYGRTSHHSRASDEFLFVMDHVAFGEVCARTAMVMDRLLPDLAVAYKKRRSRSAR